MMESPRSRATAVCALLSLVVFAGACGDSTRAPRSGGTVVIGAGSDLDHANPLVSVDAWTSEVLRFALFTPLVRYGEDLSYEPYLAESWETSGDTAVTFHLRDDVRWHDGTRTTAHDVLFTYERATDPETGFPNSDYFNRWTGGEVLDSFTIRFTFQPHAEPLAGLPFTPVVPRHLLDSIPAAQLRQAAFNQHPVGNGPFRFVSQRSNDRWVFERNPDFPEGLGGPPNLDRLVWRVIPENSAQLAEIRAGEADLILQPRP
ncbi:MAG TPA: ABC transporter substrate-binding protein, partial [Longimicrobiales bacterium]|nr:ABC transporter substrate-binding protein [Longimicrobiales bacterium]